MASDSVRKYSTIETGQDSIYNDLSFFQKCGLFTVLQFVYFNIDAVTYNAVLTSLASASSGSGKRSGESDSEKKTE